MICRKRKQGEWNRESWNYMFQYSGDGGLAQEWYLIRPKWSEWLVKCLYCRKVTGSCKSKCQIPGMRVYLVNYMSSKDTNNAGISRRGKDGWGLIWGGI